MAKSIFSIELQGFGSGQIDFSARLSTLPPEILEPLAKLIDGTFETSSDPGGTKFMSISVVGHSDRQDLLGMSNEQRRESEFKASQERADSASNWLLNKLADMQNPGDVIQLDWRSVSNIGVAVIASGAAKLINPNPGNDENLRLQNRRVEFIVTAINVNTLQELDNNNISIG